MPEPMNAIKTMKQIPTSRTIASFRSGSSLTRLSSASQDRARIAVGLAHIQRQEARRRWLNAMESV